TVNRSRALKQTLLAVVGQVHFRKPSLGGRAVGVEPAAGDVLHLVEARVLVGKGFGPGRGEFRRGLGELTYVSLDSGFARGAGWQPLQPLAGGGWITRRPVRHEFAGRALPQLAFAETSYPGAGGVRLAAGPLGDDGECRAVAGFTVREGGDEAGGILGRTLRPARSDARQGLVAGFTLGKLVGPGDGGLGVGLRPLDRKSVV